MERVGFGKRLGAFVLDVIFSVTLVIIFNFTLFRVWFALWPILDYLEDVAEGFGVPSIFSIEVCLYGLWEGFTGATLGKVVFGLRIANEDGTMAKTRTLLIRYAIKYSGWLFLLLGLACLFALFLLWDSNVRIGIFAWPMVISGALGFLGIIVISIGCFFALGRDRQALHDVVAKTAVYAVAEKEK